jgi:hypothetical protein
MLDRMFTRMKLNFIVGLVVFVIVVIAIIWFSSGMRNVMNGNIDKNDIFTVSTKKEKGLFGKWVPNPKLSYLYSENVTIEFNSDGSCSYVSEKKNNDGTTTPYKSLTGTCYLTKKKNSLKLKYKDTNGAEKEEIWYTFGYDGDTVTLGSMNLKKAS